MGKRGPHSLPENVRKLRAGRHNPGEAKTPARPKEGNAPEPPDDLAPYARTIWERLAPDLHDNGCLTEWDRLAFIQYCELHAELAEAWEEVKDYGATQKPDEWKVIKDIDSMLQKYNARFGLTPQDRQNLDVKPTEKPDSSGRLLTGA